MSTSINPVFSPARISSFLLLFLTFVRASVAQEIVDSLFAPQSSDTNYSNPANWTPPEVPNNSPTKSYNVTVRSPVSLDIDATVSNLVIESVSGRLQQENHSLLVIGTTTINRGSTTFGPEDIAVFSFNASGASFVTDSLSTFSGGVLSGAFRLEAPNSISGSATLQFHGADVRTLSGQLSLLGPLTRIIDESGNDGLRSLTQIDGEAGLQLSGHQTTLPGPFTNNGYLGVHNAVNQSGLLTITGELTNFDPGTRTLKSGVFDLGGTLQFHGANIVNNGGNILLDDSQAKIIDENGADALRNFSHNLPGGAFSVANFNYVKAGNFTNDGTLAVSNGILTLEGQLTNFDPVTHTLTGGAYNFLLPNGLANSGSLIFTDADIQNNAAYLNLYGTARIRDQNGNDALRNLSHNLPEGSLWLADFDFIATSDFTNSGVVTIASQSISPLQPHFVLPKNHRYLQSEGATHLWGSAIVGDMEINGGSFDAFGIASPVGEATHPAVLDGNLTVGKALFTPGDMTVHGAVQLSTGSTLSTSGNFPSAAFTVTEDFTAAGTLQIATPYTPPSSTATFFVVQSVSGNVAGTFSNAPNGTRIPTVDGLGSFVVSYNPQSITISGYQALPATAHLLNISTRAVVETGEDVLVGGFIIAGTQSKKVIVRALGPSLSSSLGTLPDPVLELHDSSGALIGSNDNWRTDQEAEIIATGIPPTNDLESAIVATLPANNSSYTAVVRGADSNGIGVGIVEVYDLDRAADSRLLNISTRGIVAEGDYALIGGLLALNSNSTRVIVRALGPSLPLSGHLSDPNLSLYDSNGTRIAFNDNWRSDQEDEIIATGIPPGNDLDAAIVTTLPAFGGSYTAVVLGKDFTQGVGLVEVYDLSP